MSNELTHVKKPSIWFIHGANATPTSFSAIQTKLHEFEEMDGTEFVNVRYDCQDPIASTVEIIADSLPSDRPIYLIGHSLGGVLAVAVSQRVKHFELGKDIKGVITMASPIGGCEGADYLQWLFPHYHLFKNISTKNRVVNDIKAVGAVVPTLNFITTSGNNPIYPESNDGVVTVNSQRALRRAKKIEVPFNHFEVLLSDSVVSHIKTAIFNPDQVFGIEFSTHTVQTSDD
jgi:pimeloyl-ACP methyl ester carboxylesterase